MRNTKRFKQHGMAQAVATVLTLLGAQMALADTAVDLGAVGTAGTGTVKSSQPQQGDANYEAPTQPSLTATEPQSIINQHYIEQNAAPGANYTDIISIAPSVMSVDPNGPGGMETQNITIRGFQDGQFNVTFDGIPIGDTNDFTHHSTSYFMNQDIGNIVVDRGPGDASNIGYATFGGTVAVASKNPSNTAGMTPFGAFGTWNTKLYGAQFDTGVQQNYGDGKAYISYKNFTTDGFLTDAGQRRQNILVKFERPLGDETTVTFLAMGNKLHQNVSYGTTLDQLQQNGYNYGLSSNPAQQNFYADNQDNITTDIEYLAIKSRLGTWKIDDKVYTYAYYHQGFNGGALGGAYGIGQYTANGTTLLNGNTLTSFPNDVPGNVLNNNYRSFGNILRLSKEYDRDVLDMGMWIDRQSNDKSLYEVDWTQNGAFNYPAGNGYANPLQNNIDTIGSEVITTLEPYVQYEWKPTASWTITPGVKYTSFIRDVNFPILNGHNPGSESSHDYAKFLPALTARYGVNDHWSFYSQYAQGFLAPKLQLLQKSPPVDPSTIKPESTTNYQVGTSWSDNRLVLGADAYKILTYNTTATVPCGAATCYQPVSNIDYSGEEFEGTFRLLKSLSLYANYAVNNYTLPSGVSPLNNVPHISGAAGVIYDDRIIYGSLIAKSVGGNYSNVSASGAPLYFGGYTITNLNLGYKPEAYLGKNTRLGFQVNNLFNRSGLYTSINSDFNGNPLYYVLPERSYMMSLTFSL
ncbi:MAG: TonB-dependent receptor [Ferrovum sp.]|nr:TonB-dependent receptor [Ferrovum sp.]